MRNKIIIFTIFIVGVVLAAPVSLDKAERVVANIYKERSNVENLDRFSIRSIDILDENGINLVYVFQIGLDGFIMVSGDDRVQPILAYSFESDFILKDAPTSVIWMIDSYKGMIKRAIDSDESATEEINAKWQKYSTAGSPCSRGPNLYFLTWPVFLKLAMMRNECWGGPLTRFQPSGH